MTKRNCKSCSRWQGIKGGKYGDCYMLIGQLIPNFFLCVDDFGYGFALPFDPHDIRYYTRSLLFRKLYRKLYSLSFKKEIRKDIVIIQDISTNFITEKPMKLLFLQTHKWYHCDYWENKNGTS